MQPVPGPYPAQLVFAPPDRIANWRPLVQWLLAIPHFMVLYALRSVVEILAVISWFIIVFTGGLPDGIARVQAMFLRYQARVSLYAGFLQEEYPPFNFDTASADPGDVSRLRVDVQPELQNRNRVTVGFRPEHTELVSDAAGSVPMVVELVEELGSDAYVHGHAKLNGEENTKDTLVVRTDGRTVPRMGEMVYVRPREGAHHVFNAETGLRI